MTKQDDGEVGQNGIGGWLEIGNEQSPTRFQHAKNFRKPAALQVVWQVMDHQDKYDLVEQIFEEAVDALFSAVGDLGHGHPSAIWVRFFEHIAAYERFYRALLGRKGSPWFVMKMRASLAALVKQHGPMPDGQSADHLSPYPSADDFVPDLVSTMFVEAITWWLEQGRPYSPQDIAKRCALLVSAIFKETSTWQ